MLATKKKQELTMSVAKVRYQKQRELDQLRQRMADAIKGAWRDHKRNWGIRESSQDEGYGGLTPQNVGFFGLGGQF